MQLVMQLSVSAILRVPVRLHPDLRLFLLPGGPLLPALLPVLVHGASGSALEDQEQTDSRQERKPLPDQQLLQSRPPAEWRRVGKDTQERPSGLKQRALLLVFLTSDLCIKTVHWVRGSGWRDGGSDTDVTLMKQSQQKPNIVVLELFFLTTDHHLACFNISSFTFFPAGKLSDFCSTAHTQNKIKSAHHVTEKRNYAVLRTRWTLSDCNVLIPFVWKPLSLPRPGRG